MHCDPTIVAGVHIHTSMQCNKRQPEGETADVRNIALRGVDRVCEMQVDLHRVETALVPIPSKTSEDEESTILTFYFKLESLDSKSTWPAPSLYVSKRHNK